VSRMDVVSALGLVASVDQLLGLTKAVVSNMWQYTLDVKNAGNNAGKLRREMSTICDLLPSLLDVVGSDGHPITSSLPAAIKEFKIILEEMIPRVSEGQVKGMKRLQWPFKKAETDKLLDEISRYKETFILALNVQHA
jgi:hypothetical protein